MKSHPHLFVEQFLSHVRAQPEQIGCTFLTGRNLVARDFSYSLVHAGAVRIAQTLLSENLSRQPVGLVADNSIDFVIALLGCFYANSIAVPIPGSLFGSSRNRARSILETPGLAAVLETPTAPAPWPLPEGLTRVCVSFDASDASDAGDANEFKPAQCSPDDVVLIQYTSGSVANPKGVAITHANIAINQHMIREAFQHNSPDSSVGVNWLPFYHDMGLMGGLLQPLYVGSRVVQLSPMDFLKRPLLWLQAISSYRAASSGAPCFAYQLCNDVLEKRQQPCLDLDLSTWKVAFCGAEPISAEVLARFVKNFSDSRFSPRSLFPCYGMAEATLMVSGADYQGGMRMFTWSDPKTGAIRQVVSCGKILGDQCVRVLSPSGEILADEQEGEIHIAGSNLFPGYWYDGRLMKPVGVRIERDKHDYYPTGDLGFLYNNELYVTGRLKELIVVNGANYYPQDITWALAEEYSQLDKLHGVAFQLNAEHGSIVVLHELKRGVCLADNDRGELIAAIKKTIKSLFGLSVADVKVLRSGQLHRTSSGKLQFERCKRMYHEELCKVD